MALIKCPECGKAFSDKAPACPECGCPVDYAVKEAEQKAVEQQKKAEAVYASHTSAFELYQTILEQEWNHYLDYHEKERRLSVEARAAAERIVDKQIEEEENTLCQLQQKRAALKLFAFSEKKAMDEQIAQQVNRIDGLKQERKDKITSIWLTLTVSELDMDRDVIAQNISMLETPIRLHAEREKAVQKLMFPAEGGWDLSSSTCMSRSEFEKGFRDRFIASLLAPCIEELGAVNPKEFARYTGFSVDDINITVMSRCNVSKTKDQESGEELLVPAAPLSLSLFKAPKVSGSSGGSHIRVGSSSGRREKSASVVGRAAVGAAIAGPVGALIGALSAVDKNNRNG